MKEEIRVEDETTVIGETPRMLKTTAGGSTLNIPTMNVSTVEKDQPEPEINEHIGEESSQTESGIDEENSSFDPSDTQSVPEFNNKRITLQRFTIYNSIFTMYIVGSNAKESLFRILEINKDPEDETNLSIIEDKSYFYTRKDMIDLINGLNESIDGGIHKIAQGYGLLGLIKFTRGYYLSIITKCSQVAIIGGHYIYHIDETKLVPLDINYKRPNKYTDEERLLSIFKYLDLGKTFYFSYAYDITNTLQTNFVRNKRLATVYERTQGASQGQVPLSFQGDKQRQTNDDRERGEPSGQGTRLGSESPHFGFDRNDRFVWNHLLLSPILNNDVAIYEWFQPIIHGFVDQANVSIYGKKVYITIIARRSRHFAGARFLKRGVNYDGNVANEIETEQIVTDMLVSSFHDPKYGFYNNPRFTSFVQHRGSIPLYWTQDLNRLPKPPIEINLSDPFYSSSAMHFNNLFQRYGSPVVILNLIKTKEKTPRESKLNYHFVNCINYLNQFLPTDQKLQYHSFDMSKHSKKNMDVITPLQNIAEKSINEIGFFHNGVSMEQTKLQKGVIRTNCIDCLDRTNAAQFIICKEALACQLASLGLIYKSTTLSYDSDLINILTEIFHDHGDTIAIQYGGSNLVNTMDSYRRINQWSSHTRDMLNSVKRIYSNSFMDSIRQEAINLFLGNYVYDPSKPKLWELQNDFYLHNDMSKTMIRTKTSYLQWYNNRALGMERYGFKFIAPCPIPQQFKPFLYERLKPFPDFNDNWFNECYVPRKFQSLTDLFMFNMNSNSRYFPPNMTNKQFDYSPFESRKQVLKDFENEKNKDEKKTEDKTKDEKTKEDSTKEEFDDNEKENGEAEIQYVQPQATTKPDNSFQSDRGSKIMDTHPSTYLNNLANKKIRNLLTSGMEKLGYQKEKKNKYISDTDTPRRNDSIIDEDNESLIPSVSEYDQDVYARHLAIGSWETPSLNTVDVTQIKMMDYDADVYRRYTEFQFNDKVDLEAYDDYFR